MSAEAASFRSSWISELDEAARTLDALRSRLDQVEEIAAILASVLRSGGTIFACGNGGSALEAQHFAAELLGHYRRDRSALKCMVLSAGAGVLTAIANDYEFRLVFARQLEGLATSRDALLAFTTSGKSPNVVEAVRTARSIGMRTIAFTGSDGGMMPGLAERVLTIPAADTQRAQEAHLLLVHLIAGYLDDTFGGEPR